MCLIRGHVSPEYNSQESKTVRKLRNICLNLKPVPGIQFVVSVRIKITAVKYFPLQPHLHPFPPPQKINIRAGDVQR